jgi:hypothetical protein
MSTDRPCGKTPEPCVPAIWPLLVTAWRFEGLKDAQDEKSDASEEA